MTPEAAKAHDRRGRMLPKLDVHRLIKYVFDGDNRPAVPSGDRVVVDHRNRCTDNNQLSNLKWEFHKKNAGKSKRRDNGRYYGAKILVACDGEKWVGKLTTLSGRSIDKDGKSPERLIERLLRALVAIPLHKEKQVFRCRSKSLIKIPENFYLLNSRGEPVSDKSDIVQARGGATRKTRFGHLPLEMEWAVAPEWAIPPKLVFRSRS
jgi:hypothetical protein